MLIIGFMITVLLLAVIFLDILRKIDLTHKAVMSVFLLVVPHITLVFYLFNQFSKEHANPVFWTYLLVLSLILFTYLWLKVNIIPHSNKQIVDLRLRVLLGGRRLVLYGFYTCFAQILIYCFSKSLLASYSLPSYILICDIVITLLFILTLHVNGMLRIIITSRRLNIFKKVILTSMMLIPFINIFLILYVSNIAKSEYTYEYYRVINRNIKIDSAICKTKYPIIMLHGAGFKDFKYLNYWGRIPKELMSHGATLHYGNQDAWGTLENNAQHLKDKILEIINSTNCEKINIIAHSKGGLDARYMISLLNMADYVSSLTMISSPNRGSKIIDILYRFPKKIFQVMVLCIDKYFRLLGDKNSDFSTAINQLSTTYCEKFNEEVKDAKQVYYQSYASVMNNIFSDYILTIPCFLLWLIDGKNDGLVTVESAKWGEFKGILKSKHSRGISHGDIIDLRKNDYKGFDAKEKFVEIVVDLKMHGN